MSIICQRGYNILKSKEVDMVYIRADGTDNGFKCLSQDPLKYTSFKVPIRTRTFKENLTPKLFGDERCISQLFAFTKMIWKSMRWILSSFNTWD
jgi:hypothetical protein